MGKHDGRSGRRWRRAVAQLKSESLPICWICGYDIDMTLPHLHPRAWTAEHVQPLSAGGDPYDPDNLRPAHRGCNSRKGNGPPPIPPRGSHRW
ncbi:HNH endonuclease [Streptomyces sp. KL116D]|uniref:HNH endonuclease n=1 Tax=Streptomyces sp. KL116D TaxID=3045152 RepID=UPI0035569121